jgi:hypothetical protein
MDFQEGADKIILKGSTRGLAIKSYQDSSYISRNGNILAWVDRVEGALLGWDSAHLIT